jgi:predicted glycoside hydrolase/deacetylase ChbG (UPF0249 family)
MDHTFQSVDSRSDGLLEIAQFPELQGIAMSPEFADSHHHVHRLPGT